MRYDHGNAELAQLARASPCHGEGCEFDSRIPLFALGVILW